MALGTELQNELVAVQVNSSYRGTRVSVPGYEDINAGVRGYQCRGTSVFDRDKFELRVYLIGGIRSGCEVLDPGSLINPY